MKIAFAISTRNWGGVKTWMLRLAQNLASRSIGSRFYHADGKFGYRLDEAGLQHRRIRFGMDFSPRRILCFLQEFRSFRPDILITNIDKDDRSAGVAAWLLGIPVVKRIGAPGDIQNNFRTRWIQGRLVDGFICPARHIKSHITMFPWIDPDKVLVIENGVDTAPIPACKGETFRKAHGITGDAIAVGVTSRLSESKGHSSLIRALAGLEEPVRREIHLFVANDGPVKNDLANLCRELHMSGQVTFTGYIEDTAGFLKAMDILILPSLEEGMPNNLLEYLAAEKPVIAAAIPGIDEIIDDGANGLLFEAGNASALGGRILRLIQEPALRNRISTNGRKTIEQRYGVDQMVEKTLTVMESIIARKRMSGGKIRRP